METQSINESKKPQTRLIVIGYVLLALSLALYSVCEYLQLKNNLFSIFWIHYGISVTYTVILIQNQVYGIFRSWRKENITIMVIASNIYLISAYALNRELSVFAKSVDWLCYYILLTSFTLLSFQYFSKLPS